MVVDRGARGVFLEFARGYEQSPAMHKDRRDLACRKKLLTRLIQRCVERRNIPSKHRPQDTNHLIRTRDFGKKLRMANAICWQALSNITVRNPGYVLTELLLVERERKYKQHIQMPMLGSSQQEPLRIQTYLREFFESFAKGER